jgi:hypothetical protein
MPRGACTDHIAHTLQHAGDLACARARA